MKYLGMIIITICTTLVGYSICERLKNQIKICEQLVIFSNLLINDLSTILTPTPILLSKLKCNKNLDKLIFLQNVNLSSKTNVCLDLSDDENKQLTELIYSLGKFDPVSQINSINYFAEYINNSKNKYETNYNKYKKLYVTIGFLSGVFISILIA